MLSLFLMAALGQTGAKPRPPLETWHIKCPLGHPINVKGYYDGSSFVATFPANVTRPTGRNYGVSFEKFPAMTPGKEWHGGNVNYKPAVGAKGERPNRVHLTFIGTQVEREAARKDLEKSPDYQRLAAELGDNLAVQDYGPENPLVAEIGLVDGGRPDIVIQQTKGGKVFYRAHSYPGSDVLVGEIRKADPNYSPAHDPSGGVFAGLKMPAFLAEMPPAELYGCVAVLGLLVVAVIKGAL